MSIEIAGTEAFAGNGAQREIMRERALIPDDTIISDLLEGLRVERTSYSIFEDGNIPTGGRGNFDELIGIFFIDGNVELSFPGIDPISARKTDFALISRGKHYSIKPLPESGPCSIGRVTFRLDNSRARLLFRILPEVIFISSMSEAEME